MNRAVFLLPRRGASTASQETPVDPDPGLSAPDVSPPKARRSRSGVRGLLVVIASCGVLMWATRTLWDSQHPAIAAARGLEARLERLQGSISSVSDAVTHRYFAQDMPTEWRRGGAGG